MFKAKQGASKSQPIIAYRTITTTRYVATFTMDYAYSEREFHGQGVSGNVESEEDEQHDDDFAQEFADDLAMFESVLSSDLDASRKDQPALPAPFILPPLASALPASAAEKAKLPEKREILWKFFTRRVAEKQWALAHLVFCQTCRTIRNLSNFTRRS
jgi:hypothetical protein